MSNQSHFSRAVGVSWSIVERYCAACDYANLDTWTLYHAEYAIVKWGRSLAIAVQVSIKCICIRPYNLSPNLC
jgi:hypothetical protein